jgi:hypothetical protein
MHRILQLDQLPGRLVTSPTAVDGGNLYLLAFAVHLELVGGGGAAETMEREQS